MDKGFSIPILFLVFNRPETTLKVWREIVRIRPTKLYIVADGPRDREDDRTKCGEVRAIFEQISWNCKVTKLFRSENLGCGLSVSGGISWFFEQEEMGIILEDDCLPSGSFFSFCERMLLKYRDDNRIMHISGNNLQFGRKYGDGTYYYSKLSNIWGWATWKRAWQLYDYRIRSYDQFLQQDQIENILPKGHFGYRDVFKRAYEGRGEWDYQWAYTLLVNNGLAITPNVNLVSNIGFGGGTNSILKESRLANQSVEDLVEFKNPTFMIPSLKADEHFVKLTVPGLFEKLLIVWKKGELKQVLKRKWGRL